MHRVEASGARIPAIGLGTWTLKGDACSALVEEALRVGYRHIDTAIMYDNEAAVGAGLRSSPVPRADIFLTTKVWYTDIAPGRLERAAEASLKRLGVDYLDLLLIHWPNPRVPLAGSIGALNAVLRAGLTLHIGVSNFTLPLLGEAIALSEAPLACNQVEHHPYLDQSRLLAACRAAAMAMVSYCPLHRGGDLFALPLIRRIAAAHGKTPAQIVLRWHIQQPGVIAIPRTTRPGRLAENIAITDFALTAQEMAEISALQTAGDRICNYDFAPAWDAA